MQELDLAPVVCVLVLGAARVDAAVRGVSTLAVTDAVPVTEGNSFSVLCRQLADSESSTL